MVEWNRVLWNGVECYTIEVTRRIWSGMGCYLRKWNAMKCNGMLQRVSEMLTSGMESHGMIKGCNVMQ